MSICTFTPLHYEGRNPEALAANDKGSEYEIVKEISNFLIHNMYRNPAVTSYVLEKGFAYKEM